MSSSVITRSACTTCGVDGVDRLASVQMAVLMAAVRTARAGCSTLAGRAPVLTDGKVQRARSPWKPAATVAPTKTKVTSRSLVVSPLFLREYECLVFAPAWRGRGTVLTRVCVFVCLPVCLLAG